jgi:hypothetical protein
MSAKAGDRATESAAAPEAAARDGGAAPIGAVLAAGVGLFDAMRRTLTALAALLAAEARVLRASVAMVFLGSIALVAFAVSLWACVVALIGWALTLATHSPGIALAILVVVHLALMAVLWLAIKRAIRSASFPGTRSELRALGRELRGHVERFQRATPPDPPDPSP